MSYKLQTVRGEVFGKCCDLSDKELYIRRRDIRKAMYVGFATIGLSIPVVIVNYLPLINNFIKTHDVDARTIGSVGITVGANLIASGLIRSYEYFKNINEINKKFEELKSIRREELEEPQIITSKSKAASVDTNKRNRKRKRSEWKANRSERFR